MEPGTQPETQPVTQPESQPELQPEQDVVTAMVQYYLNMKRGPYKSNDALKKAKTTDPSSTARIFVDENEIAWYAYYAVQRGVESQHGFAGKAALTHLLNQLHNKPIENQRILARKIAQAIGVGEAATRSAKRRRIQYQNNISTPNALTNSPDPDNEDVDYRDSEETSGIVNSQEAIHVEASLVAAKRLFPPEFMDAIKRMPSAQLPNNLVADIAMFLQKGYHRDQFGCQMEIGIVKEKVAYYAKKLFDVEVEAKDGVRYLRYPGGGKVEPDSSIKLRACQRDVIPYVFGTDVDHGFSSAPIYQREEREVRERTDGVSMTITNRVDEDGLITLYLGEWHAFSIKDRLFN